jgi:hypothetical protein
MAKSGRGLQSILLACRELPLFERACHPLAAIALNGLTAYINTDITPVPKGSSDG